MMTESEARRALRNYATADADLTGAILAARKAGIDITEIAELAGISRPRIYRLIEAATTRERMATVEIQPGMGGLSGVNTLVSEYLGRHVYASQGGRLGAEVTLGATEATDLYHHVRSEGRNAYISFHKA